MINISKELRRIEEELDVGVSNDDGFDPEQIDMALNVEEEHRKTIEWLISQLGGNIDSPNVKKLIGTAIEMIGKDHLKENPEYYTHLLAMEKQWGGHKNA